MFENLVRIIYNNTKNYIYFLRSCGEVHIFDLTNNIWIGMQYINFSTGNIIPIIDKRKFLIYSKESFDYLELLDNADYFLMKKDIMKIKMGAVTMQTYFKNDKLYIYTCNLTSDVKFIYIYSIFDESKNEMQK